MKIIVYVTAVALLISGCSTNQRFRTSDIPCIENSRTLDSCATSSFITLQNDEKGRADMAFIEFNKDGKLFNDKATATTIQQIEDRSKEADSNGLLIIVFIHGWNHNAAPSDTNVTKFREFLVAAKEEESRQKISGRRQVMGVYIGWQGYAGDNKLIKLLSFRKKKELALKTGYFGLAPVLEQLANIRADNQNNRLVTIGHSFGGGVLYSAIKDDLLLDWNGGRNPKAPYGDLALLINPAVEAGQFVGIHRTLTKGGRGCSDLRMASFTSDNDTDLSREFPRGMGLFYSSQLERYGDEQLMKEPFGVYQEYIQFDLKLTDRVAVDSPLDAQQFNEAAKGWNGFRSGDSDFQLVGTSLKNRFGSGSQMTKWPSVINVRVEQSIIDRHNGIWKPEFANFIRYFIGMEFAKRAGCPVVK